MPRLRGFDFGILKEFMQHCEIPPSVHTEPFPNTAATGLVPAPSNPLSLRTRNPLMLASTFDHPALVACCEAIFGENGDLAKPNWNRLPIRRRIVITRPPEFRCEAPEIGRAHRRALRCTPFGPIVMTRRVMSKPSRVRGHIGDTRCFLLLLEQHPVRSRSFSLLQLRLAIPLSRR